MVDKLNVPDKYRTPQIDPKVPKTDTNGSIMKNVFHPPVTLEFK